MQIASHPRRPEVAALLSQCGLPSDDLRPESLPDFVLASEGGEAVGVAGLEVFGATALVRSVGVVPRERSRGLGAQLLAAVEARARARGVGTLYLLTNDSERFFAKHGYAEAARGSAPAEIQGCSQFGSSCCAGATLMSKALGA